MSTASATHFDADELLALARIDLAADRLAEGLDKLKAALTVEDCPKEAYADIGRLYAKLELRERARDAFSRYLELNPEVVLERFQLGMLEFESGDVHVAVEHWAKVLKLDENYPPALFYMALAHAQMEDIESAKSYLNQIQQNIEETNLYFQRATELRSKLDGQTDAGRPSIGTDDPKGAKH